MSVPLKQHVNAVLNQSLLPLFCLATGVFKGIIKHFDIITEMHVLFGFFPFKDRTHSFQKNS